jgi:hypothetical protein
VKLGTKPLIISAQGNPVGGKGSQVKKWDTLNTPTVGRQWKQLLLSSPLPLPLLLLLLFLLLDRVSLYCPGCTRIHLVN